MELRSLAISGGALAAAILSPLVLAFALTNRSDVARGLVVGLLIGLLNNLLLARKLDRVIAGRDPWASLARTMPRNLLVRFALIFGCGAAAAHVHGINLAGLAAGLGVCLVVGLIYSGWAVRSRWAKSERTPAYG